MYGKIDLPVNILSGRPVVGNILCFLRLSYLIRGVLLAPKGGCGSCCMNGDIAFALPTTATAAAVADKMSQFF